MRTSSIVLFAGIVAIATGSSIPAYGQNDARAEELLHVNADETDTALGITASIVGATLVAGGIALDTTAHWDAPSCPECLSTLALLLGGAQLSFVGIMNLTEIGSYHKGRGHRRRVRSMLDAMLHASDRAAASAKRTRLVIGASLAFASAAHAAAGIALLAMGHQPGIDDSVRNALGGLSLFVGGWVGSAAAGVLGTRSFPELAIAPTREGATFMLRGTF